jgi:hypothetical protein
MKLYLAHLGFYDEKYGMYELHTNKHVVAKDLTDAKRKLLSDPEVIQLKMHVDGLQEINHVDGYDIALNARDNAKDARNPSFNHSEVKKIPV